MGFQKTWVFKKPSAVRVLVRRRFRNRAGFAVNTGCILRGLRQLDGNHE
jgi:hypothetical protein